VEDDVESQAGITPSQEPRDEYKMS